MSQRQRGFTLIELIVVIHVIGVIAGIAVPNLIASRRSANGASAVEATRLFHDAESTYRATVGNGSFGTATDLFEQDLIDAELAGAAGVPAGTTSIGHNQVVPGSPSGKSGYSYAVEIVLPSDTEPSRFYAEAIPVAIHRTGDRSFFIDETGILTFRCSPPKHWSDETHRCEPADDVTDGAAVLVLTGIEALTDDNLLRMVVTDPPEPGRIQKVLSLLDGNADRMLTLHEVIKADVLGIARSLTGTGSDSKKPQASDRALDRLLKQFTGDLERELALGVGNEGEIALPFVEMKGDLVRLLELAMKFTPPIQR